jgi:3-hydroxybutyryl-CoA dehydratase
MTFDASKYNIEDIETGLQKEFKLKITESMLNDFAKLSGDYTPLHTDEEFAKKTKFKRKICYGFLLASFFSRLYGMYIPGERSLCLSQTLKFVSPCYIGDEITVKGEVVSKGSSSRIITLKTEITNSIGECLVEGEAKNLVLEIDSA